MDLIPCRLSHILMEEHTDSQLVFISELEGPRRFSIAIGPLEAVAIDRGIKKESFPRPLTHDLLSGVIAMAGMTCKELRILDFRDGTFYANLILDDPEGAEKAIDCRPSDGLALVARQPNCRIVVAADILEAASEL